MMNMGCQGVVRGEMLVELQEEKTTYAIQLEIIVESRVLETVEIMYTKLDGRGDLFEVLKEQSPRERQRRGNKCARTSLDSRMPLSCLFELVSER